MPKVWMRTQSILTDLFFASRIGVMVSSIDPQRYLWAQRIFLWLHAQLSIRENLSYAGEYSRSDYGIRHASIQAYKDSAVNGNELFSVASRYLLCRLFIAASPKEHLVRQTMQGRKLCFEGPS